MQGKPGKNVPCDLHIEHLNRRLKDMIRNIHSKNPENAIDRIAKSIGTINQVCEILEQENQALKISGRHTRPAFTKELNLMVGELEDQQVFKSLNRKPPCYRHIKNTLQVCSKEKLKVWIPNKIKKYQL